MSSSGSASNPDEKSSPKDSELFALIRSKLPEKNIIEQAKKLLAAGASLRARSNGPSGTDKQFQNTPCIEAIILGKKDLARFLIRHAIATKDFESLNMQDKNQVSQNNPLLLCIKKNWIELALLLINAAEVKIDVLAADKFSAMHYACLLRQDDVIAALVGRGGNIKAENRFGAIPSDYYLYEFSELDNLRTFDKRTGHLLSHSGLPDLQHANHFEGLEERKKVTNGKVVEFLGNLKTLSDKFKNHLREYHESVLVNQIDVVSSQSTHKFSTPFSIFKKPAEQIKFDELLAKKFLELEPLQMSDQARLEEAKNLAKKEFIEEYLKKEEKDAKVDSPGIKNK